MMVHEDDADLAEQCSVSRVCMGDLTGRRGAKCPDCSERLSQNFQCVKNNLGGGVDAVRHASKLRSEAHTIATMQAATRVLCSISRSAPQ